MKKYHTNTKTGIIGRSNLSNKDFSGYAVEKRKKTNQGYAEFA